MNRPLRILEVDWERLRAAHPGVDDQQLVEQVIARGRSILDACPDTLRSRFAREAALVAVHRFTYVTSRERFRAAERDEQLTYELHVELDRELVPPLKEEARELRTELRALEDALRARGVDPETVEPQVDWSRTLAVDAYTRPHYESNEERRKRAVEFFRRLDKP